MIDIGGHTFLNNTLICVSPIKKACENLYHITIGLADGSDLIIKGTLEEIKETRTSRARVVAYIEEAIPS